MRRACHLPAAALAAALAACGHDTTTFRIEQGATVVGAVREVEVDTAAPVGDLSRQFGVGTPQLAVLNPRLRQRARAGDRIRIPAQYVLPPAPRRGIVVNLAEPRLYFYPGDDGDPDEVMTFLVAVGREEWETPVGQTTVIERIVDPTWYPPESIREESAEKGRALPAAVPPGEKNPLGKYALRLGWGKHLIHGTNQPGSVGKAASHGCIRLYPEDMEKLFDEAPEGTPVTLIDAPYKLGQRDGQLFVEAHALAAGADADDLKERLMRDLERHLREHPGTRVDRATLSAALARPTGIPVLISAN
jgi:L,D-transpeptidase ErfK/SrfK